MLKHESQRQEAKCSSPSGEVPVLTTPEEYRSVLLGKDHYGGLSTLQRYDIILLAGESPFGVVLTPPERGREGALYSPFLALKGTGWEARADLHRAGTIVCGSEEHLGCAYFSLSDVLGIVKVSRRDASHSPFWHAGNLGSYTNLASATMVSLEHWLENTLYPLTIPRFKEKPVWWAGENCALCKRCKEMAGAACKPVHSQEECPLLIQGTESCLGGVWGHMRDEDSLEYKLQMITALLDTLRPVSMGDAVLIEYTSEQQKPKVVRGLVTGKSALMRESYELLLFPADGAEEMKPSLYFWIQAGKESLCAEDLVSAWEINTHRGVFGVGVLGVGSLQHKGVLRIPHSKKALIQRAHDQLCPKDAESIMLTVNNKVVLESIMLTVNNKVVLGVADSQGVPKVILGGNSHSDDAEHQTGPDEMLGYAVSFADPVLQGMYQRHPVDLGGTVDYDGDTPILGGTQYSTTVELLVLAVGGEDAEELFFVNQRGELVTCTTSRSYLVSFGVAYSGPSVSVSVEARDEEEAEELARDMLAGGDLYGYIDMDDAEAEIDECLGVEEDD